MWMVPQKIKQGLLALALFWGSCTIAAPVFPGAVGYGTETVAGKGGQIIRVTNLNATGAGSLREALATPGHRIIVFEVAGNIDLDKTDLKLTEPFVTIAGQTAPSPGISIIRGGMEIQTHDVLMQHLRFRMGDAGMSKKSGYEKDVSIEGANAYNVVVDHCSFAWGTDESLSISGPRYDGPGKTAHQITLSHNIIAEGLDNSTHSKGRHSMGTLVHDNVRDVAIISNLFAHQNERNPWFKGNTNGLIVNNYIYNPGIWAIRLGANPKEWPNQPMPPLPEVSIVGNVMQQGANTKAGLALVGTNTNNGSAWLDDNLAFLPDGQPAPLTSEGITILAQRPWWIASLRPLPAAQVKENVLTHAGARPKDRDAEDLRLVADIRAGRGRMLNSQDEVGGYPQLPAVVRPLSIPSEQVDAWLQQLAAELE